MHPTEIYDAIIVKNMLDYQISYTEALLRCIDLNLTEMIFLSEKFIIDKLDFKTLNNKMLNN